MGEDRPMQVCPGAPVELSCNGDMADQSPVLYAHHRTSHRGAIADINADSAERFRRIWKLGNVRYVKESTYLGRDAVSDGWRADGMLNGIGLERYSANRDCFFDRHTASITEGKTTNQAQRLACSINWARCALSKTSGVIWMSMCQQDRRWRNGRQSAKPIRAAINHDSSIILLDKQRTVASMPTRINLELAPRTEKR